VINFQSQKGFIYEHHVIQSSKDFTFHASSAIKESSIS